MKARIIRFPTERVSNPYQSLSLEQRLMLAQLERLESEKPTVGTGTLWWCTVAVLGWVTALALVVLA